MAIFKSKTINSGMDAKTTKGNYGQWQTAILYLAPYLAAGKNVCPMAETAQCHIACLYTAGRGQMSNVQKARIAKTKRYLADRIVFMHQLTKDTEKFLRFCAKHNKRPAIRLNGTSDIQWEIGHPVTRNGETFPHIFAAFPEVKFYDYTKIYKRVYRELPENYRLVLSYSEANPAYANEIRAAQKNTNCNIAVVYRTKELRDSLLDNHINVEPGFSVPAQVIDGDSDDMRFLDPEGVIVGLYAKGQAKTDKTGFVIG